MILFCDCAFLMLCKISITCFYFEMPAFVGAASFRGGTFMCPALIGWLTEAAILESIYRCSLALVCKAARLNPWDLTTPPVSESLFLPPEPTLPSMWKPNVALPLRSVCLGFTWFHWASFSEILIPGPTKPGLHPALWETGSGDGRRHWEILYGKYAS